MRLSIFLILSFISFLSYAQINLDRSDFGTIGDSVILTRSFNGLDSLSIGSSGPMQFWDFSSLSVDSIPDTIYFLDKANFPQANNLSGVNLVLKDGPSLQFLEANANAIFINALTFDFDTFLTNTLIIPNPKVNYLNFPISYGQTNNGTYSSNSITIPVQDTLTISTFTFYVDSARITPNIQIEDSIDAYGQLALPGKQYDVLRQKSVITISASIEVLIPNFLPFPPPFIWFPIPSGIFPDFTTTTYNFLGENRNYSLLELNVDSNDVIISARFQSDTTSSDTLTGLITDLQNLRLYPNPFNDVIKIENVQRAMSYRIFDILGRETEVKGIIEEDATLDLRQIQSGTYLLRLNSMDSQVNMQFRIFKK